MSVRNFDKLFKPRSVALIGATSRPGAVGAVVARNLRRAGFAGAASVGFPVALKIRSPDITHKTDIGGVALGLGDAKRVRCVASEMFERVRAAHPDAQLDGFVLQPMISRPGAVELLVGLVDDPNFGPLIAFGQGGTAVEVIRDSSLEFPPLNALLARRLMARTRVWQLLQGYRGKPPANMDAIVEVLSGVSQLATDHPEIRELDINPLLADP